MQEMDGFWDDNRHASVIQKEKSVLSEIIDQFNKINEQLDEFEILYDYAYEDNDSDTAQEALDVAVNFIDGFNVMEQKVLLSGDTDINNAIISVNAGAGGTESCDWAQMLFRMINRWSDSKKFKITVLDHQPGDSAGIKSVTAIVSGNFAYGYLKSEIGIHRLVRISPFDSANRRHTSFASIFVSPEIDDNIEINIEDKDIKIDVYRSGGAGGQSVNTTDSAVRITHHPTGIVVTCQNERSQLQNKAQAMKVLKSRMYDLAMEERKKEEDEVEAGKKEIGWGSQIRSYVLHPYKMVKDHRTNMEVSNAEKVLDGEIDPFIDAYLKWSVMSVEDNEC